jgi:hypothetical protein
MVPFLLALILVYFNKAKTIKNWSLQQKIGMMYCTSKKACCKKLVTATKIRAYVPREKLAVKDCHNKLSLMYLVKSLLEQVRHGEVPEQAGLPTVPLRHKGQLITLLARFLPHPTLLTYNLKIRR